MLVRSAFVHCGASRSLVHRLKYDAITGSAMILAEAMSPLIPVACAAVVPIPRLGWRTLRYGVDPARSLAQSISVITGVPLVDALIPAWFGPARARASRLARNPPIYRLRMPVTKPVVLIDDVVTTGGTIASAALVLGPAVIGAVTATAAPR
jgi:predicted amidophosphoribosyltransferase